MRENLGVSRRTALKLASAAGAYGLTRAFGVLHPRSAFAQGSDELVAGWRRDKIERLDPAIIAGPEIMQVASNIYNGLIYADHDLIPRGDLAIAKAIDRDELAKRGHFGRVLPGVGPIPAAQKLYFRDFKRQISAQRYDPDTAVCLWKESKVGKLKIKALTSVYGGNLRGA